MSLARIWPTVGAYLIVELDPPTPPAVLYVGVCSVPENGPSIKKEYDDFASRDAIVSPYTGNTIEVFLFWDPRSLLSSFDSLFIVSSYDKCITPFRKL